MHLFLTSSPCDRPSPDAAGLPCVFYEQNRFVENLRQRFVPGSQGIIIAASPDNAPRNDEMAATFAGCFAHHGMPLTGMTVVDSRNEKDLPDLLAGCGVVILSGGHVPTQNAFFQRLRLKELLSGFEGIVMGISAGTMNSAALVYAQPELPGESVDPAYQRFLPGLGLTDIMVLPHYQQVKDSLLDGKRLFEDITYADSHGHVFYALVDGSYILAEGSAATLWGEGYRIAEGRISQVCASGESLGL